MAQIPDVYCWVELIDRPTGKVILKKGHKLFKGKSMNEFRSRVEGIIFELALIHY